MTTRVCTYLSSGVRSGLNRSHELATYLIVIDIVIVIVIMNVIVHRVCWWSPVHCLAVFWWLCHRAVLVVPYVVVVVVGPYARCPFLEPAGRAAGMARVPTRVRGLRVPVLVMYLLDGDEQEFALAVSCSILPC